MPIAYLDWEQFVEMFEPIRDFSGYKYDADDECGGVIDIEWEIVPCKNPAREQGGWCAILWKPASEVWDGNWMREEYNGSSPFAFWWSQETAE